MRTNTNTVTGGDSSYLSIYYYFRPLIPIKIRHLLHRALAKNIDGFQTNPMWPLPEIPASVSPLEWPGEKELALVVTHDVDTASGFKLVRSVCEVEKRLGLKASWNFVPSLYPIDDRVLDYIRESRMEIGVHDWNHDGRLFKDECIFGERIKKINRIIKVWGASGFRAGAVFHHDDWMDRLECEYDSSYYDTDPFQPLGGGCNMVWPFMLGNLVELPYTMPQDHVLFVAGMKLTVPEEAPPGSESGERRKNWEWIREWCRINIKELEGDNYLLRGIEILKMKAEWLVEKKAMMLILIHPEYLCQTKIKSKSGKNKALAFKKKGWLDEEDEDISAVREKGIVEDKWQNTLLEQYAAFFHWLRRKYGNKTWNVLPREMAEWLRASLREEKSSLSAIKSCK